MIDEKKVAVARALMAVPSLLCCEVERRANINPLEHHCLRWFCKGLGDAAAAARCSLVSNLSSCREVEDMATREGWR